MATPETTDNVRDVLQSAVGALREGIDRMEMVQDFHRGQMPFVPQVDAAIALSKSAISKVSTILENTQPSNP